jgi:sugar/nucleoside kinase (ribokinase family)
LFLLVREPPGWEALIYSRLEDHDMDAVVVGNTTLDVICYPVDDMPRYDSISFESSIVSPGGCGSNTAIGLCAQGVSTALVTALGEDDAAFLVERYWERFGLDRRFVRRVTGCQTGTSIGLVDSQRQPRFIHTTGANARLQVQDLPIDEIIASGARALHVAGYFVLPGLLDARLADVLAKARQSGLHTSLDVVNSPRMADPSILWEILPEIDVFLCNEVEAQRITEEKGIHPAAESLRQRGANAVVIKLGAQGCWLEDAQSSRLVPGLQATVVDTTGAGDAFSAGLIAALLWGKDLPVACERANAAGSRMVSTLGAISGWMAAQ